MIQAITTETTLNLYGRIGVTYQIIGWVPAELVQEDDLLICPDQDCQCVNLVMGCSFEGDNHKLHLVREGQGWEDRETVAYPVRQHLYVARATQRGQDWAPPAR